MRLPLPAEILAQAEPAMTERRRVLATMCRVEIPPAHKAYRDMTDAEKKEFDDMMDRLRGRFPTSRAG